MCKSVTLWFLAWWQVRPLMANLSGTREGPHHYRQQGQHLSAALTAPVTYLSNMAGNNYSAGNWEARENAQEPRGPALGLLHSGKRQRRHCRIWQAVPGSALADGQMAVAVLGGQLWFHPSGQSWIPAKSSPGSALMTVCLFVKLSPLTLGECRMTPWKAEGSGVPAVSVGAPVIPPQHWVCGVRLSWLLCMYLVVGCHPELLRTDVQRSLPDVQHLWGESMYTAPCKALRVYFISCFPSYLPFKRFCGLESSH